MLSYHCPECNVPLFQEEDKIFCPSCQKEAVIEKEGGKKEIKENASTNMITPESETKREESLDQSPGTERRVIRGGSSRKSDDLDVNQMEESLKNSLLKLSKDLENAKDVKEIKEIVEVMDSIASLAERIKKL